MGALGKSFNLIKLNVARIRKFVMRHWLILGLMLLVLTIGVGAQDSDPFAPYEGIPFGRTDDGAFVLGSPDAPVTVVEFADFMCPHCQTYHSTVAQFIEQYVKTGRARLEYRLYPIVHPTYSVYAAQLAECVEAQLEGGFWPANDVLYGLAASGQIGPDTSEILGGVLGISSEKLETCAEGAVQYQTDLSVGEAIGVRGTPAVLIRNVAGELGWAYLNDQVMNRGGLSPVMLELIITAENPDALVLIPRPLLSVLTNLEGCVAPCWYGITPGETEFAGLVDVIRSERQFYEIEEHLDTVDAQAISWLSLSSGVGEPNFILADAEGVVEIVSILEANSLTLGEVIGVQGEPDYALAIRNDSAGAIVYGFFPAKSMLVLSFATLDTGLTAEASVIGAQFFSETRMKELLTATAPADWTGFQGLESYYQE